MLSARPGWRLVRVRAPGGGLNMDAQPIDNALPIPTISVPALLAARDRAQAVLLECERLHKEAASLLSPFGVVMPPLAIEAAGSEHWRLGEDYYRERVTKEIDRRIWVALFEGTHVDLLMDAKTRGDLWERLHARPGGRSCHNRQEELPEVTAESIAATLEGLHANRSKFFEDGVVQFFRALLWDYKTNRPGRLSERAIMHANAHLWADSTSISLRHCANLIDLERILCILDRQPAPTHQTGVASMRNVPFGVWVDVPHEARQLLRVKGFKNGNVHVQILNRAHVDELNRIVAKRYPDTLPRSQREGAA